MREHFPGMFDQRYEQLIFKRGEMDRLLPNRDSSRSDINHQVANGKNRRLSAAPGVSERCSHAGQQLSHSKRFRDVVVCPIIQSLHLLALLVARRKHDDRCGEPFAEPSEDFMPFHVG